MLRDWKSWGRLFAIGGSVCFALPAYGDEGPAGNQPMPRGPRFSAPANRGVDPPKPAHQIERADGQVRRGGDGRQPSLPESLHSAQERYSYPIGSTQHAEAALPSAPGAMQQPQLAERLPQSSPRRPAPPPAQPPSSRRAATDSQVKPASAIQPAPVVRLAAARLKQETIPPGRPTREGTLPQAPNRGAELRDAFPERIPFPTNGEITLEQASELAVEFNPILRRAAAQIESARGQAVQAGLWNNPRWDTNNPYVLGTGQNNQYNAGFQLEIPVKGKKRLDRAAVEQQVRQAIFDYRTDRMDMLTQVRQQFYELLAQQRRVEVSRELVSIIRRAKEVAEALQRAGVQAEIDVLAFSIELNRLEATLAQAERILAGRQRMLAATIGLPNLPLTRAVGRLDAQFPEFDEDRLRQYVATLHPRILTAGAEVDRRRILSERAAVEPYPNLYTGPAGAWGAPHVQGQFWYNFQFNIPVWNLNQGGRRAAVADIRDAQASFTVLQNDLLRQAAAALSRYRAARQMAERYGRDILPLAIRNQELNREGYEKREFDLARFLQAQRMLTEAYLEYINSLEELWRSAADVGNLLQLEQFP